MSPLAVRAILRLIAVLIGLTGLATEAEAATVLMHPDVMALATLILAEAYFYGQKGWAWARSKVTQ